MTLALSDPQLNLVLVAAEQIPHAWRNRFLEAVADRLFGIRQITDTDVAEAVRYVGARMHFAVEPQESLR